MSLSSLIVRGPTCEALRILFHGQEGVGKTTFAAGCPGALFLTAEDGGGDLDYTRAVLDNWADLRRAVKDLAVEAHDFRAVVIDTIDTYERLLWQFLCAEFDVKGIEEVGGGYGKGYTAAAEEMAGLARDLDVLRARRKMHVIVLAHSHVRPFNDPLGAPYDRYEVRMHKTSADLWKGWADAILFACFDVTVMKAGKRGRAVEAGAVEKGKALDGAKRVIYTSKEAAYDAKNRHNLPEEIPLGWAPFAKAIRWDERDAALRAPPRTAPDPNAPHDPSWAAAKGAFFATLADFGDAWGRPDAVEYDTVKAWAMSLGRPKPSAMTVDARGKLLGYLGTDKGRDALLAFVAAR